jgi:hypothetical protein
MDDVVKKSDPSIIVRRTIASSLRGGGARCEKKQTRTTQ